MALLLAVVFEQVVILVQVDWMVKLPVVQSDFVGPVGIFVLVGRTLVVAIDPLAA